MISADVFEVTGARAVRYVGVAACRCAHGSGGGRRLACNLRRWRQVVVVGPRMDRRAMRWHNARMAEGWRVQEDDAPVSPDGPGHGCWLVVANDYQWIGNPRAAGFVVYVDGKRAGIAPQGGDLRVPIKPGRYAVRVRFWYFLTPRTEVSVKPGSTTRFSADIPRTAPWWRKMRGLVDPFHWLVLKEVN